jgi:NAD(P)-dependent dehydrogenase (short-subunit alcohol dehydrogenase family)
MIDFQGQTALVTGAGAGIGRAYALELARRGASVVVNDIGRTRDGRFCADVVKDEIRAAGGQAVASHDSVATLSGGRQMVQTAVDRFGGLDILVNTVAPNVDTGMTDGVFPEDVARRIKPGFNVPLVVYLCSRHNGVSGRVFTMSAGWFARSAMVSGKGVCIGDTRREIAAEEIRDRFHEICAIDQVREFDTCGEIYSLGRPLTGR